MKKLLLTLSLVASFASVSAETHTEKATRVALETTVKVMATVGDVSGYYPKNNFRRACTAAVAITGIALSSKKAYDRYKAWKKNRKNAQVEVTENA